MLGEQLGYRSDVRAADLALRGVNLVLLVFLPELVDPPERIVADKDLPREFGRVSAKLIMPLSEEA